MAEKTLTGGEKLYVSEGGGGDTAVSVAQIAAFVSSSGGTTVTSGQITDATTVGKAVLTATTAAAARTAIGTAGQGAAVANATDATDTVTQLNALLASLRASGAIAT